MSAHSIGPICCVRKLSLGPVRGGWTGSRRPGSEIGMPDTGGGGCPQEGIFGLRTQGQCCPTARMSCWRSDTISKRRTAFLSPDRCPPGPPTTVTTPPLGPPLHTRHWLKRGFCSSYPQKCSQWLSGVATAPQAADGGPGWTTGPPWAPRTETAPSMSDREPLPYQFFSSSWKQFAHQKPGPFCSPVFPFAYWTPFSLLTLAGISVWEFTHLNISRTSFPEWY